MAPTTQTPRIDWLTAQSALRGWYASDAGAELHACIAARLQAMLAGRYALHCLQIGGTLAGADLLSGRGLIHRMHLTGDGDDSMSAHPDALPLATGSVDLVLLCHALEFVADPHALLREVDRVLTLDGQVLCVGFNPWSLLGVRRLFGGRRVPWSGHFFGAGRIGDWFALLGWRIEQRATVGFAPPAASAVVRRRLAGLERLKRALPGQGGIYVLLGRKHSVPFQPVPTRRARAQRNPVVGRAVRPTQYTETRR